MIQSIGYDETQPIRSKMFTKSIESAQKKVEGNNYDSRKSLLDYDNIVSEQRKIIYEKRNNVLDIENIQESVYLTFNDYIADYIESKLGQSNSFTKDDYQTITDYFNNNFLKYQKIEVQISKIRC